ncbi:uncharacterized protein TNCV_4964461 [Trichonephila clavipes]|nr:uncharacterized protein TNCV_4964461 [Trichonephila clavipes]
MTTPVPSPCKHYRRMLSIGGYHPYGLTSILTGLGSNRGCVGYAWPTDCNPSTPSHLSTGTRRALLEEWCNIPQDQIDNLILSLSRHCKACIASSGRHTRINHHTNHVIVFFVNRFFFEICSKE